MKTHPTKKINWGILGLGHIAEKFASDLLLSENSVLQGVASRDINKAKQFGDKYRAVNYYGSYTELAEDPIIDVIYIATPHVMHFENTMMCLKNGKSVLCEKPMGMNSDKVKIMSDYAKESNLFLMEGLWTRFIPATEKLLELLENKEIGDLVMVRADFGFKAPNNPESRVFNRNLGGGSLMDVGIYPVYLSLLTLGNPSAISAKSEFTETGVDAYCSMNFDYNKRAMSILESSIVSQTRTEALLYGTKGLIIMHPRFHHTQKLTIYKDGIFKTIFENRNRGFGYIYEIEEVNKCLQNKKTESDKLPLSMSYQISMLLDWIKSEIGLVYE
jgi:predicted dehydrogenase